jgi:Ferredoxin-like domain in Api92-like protein
MPNHVTHRGVATGTPEDLRAFVTYFDATGTLDFERIIPEGGNERESVWGTSWAASAGELDTSRLEAGEVRFKFETGWNTPMPVLKELACRCPNVYVNLAFFDDGWCFAGRLRWQGDKAVVAGIDMQDGAAVRALYREVYEADHDCDCDVCASEEPANPNKVAEYIDTRMRADLDAMLTDLMSDPVLGISSLGDSAKGYVTNAAVGSTLRWSAIVYRSLYSTETHWTLACQIVIEQARAQRDSGDDRPTPTATETDQG